jgi:HD superfamily phosphohydrolase
MTDAQLISVLIKADGVPGNLVSRILYRKLYKTAFVITSTDSSFHDKLEQILRNMTAEQIETEISRIAGIERHEVIVDTPVEVLKLSEPRLKQLEMDVLTKNGTVKALRDISPLAKALEGKESTHVLFAVFTPVEYRTTVGKAAEQLLT